MTFDSTPNVLGLIKKINCLLYVGMYVCKYDGEAVS